ncbi:response regulator [Vibrio ponticus]|nr:response regulator [Vibrio ponticus]
MAEIRDLPLSQAAQSLQNISPNDAVLLTHYNTETEQGVYHGYNYLAHQFASNSAAPVFVFWEFFITDGVFGGYVHRSTHIGTQMAVALAKFLPIKFSDELDIERIEQTVVDHRALSRFNIKPADLPDETVYLNQPQSYLKQNWQIVSIGLSIFFCMALVIVTQGIYIRQKKRINKQNKKIVRLQKRTLKSQKDMIMVLGDAIETRSGETGHHVRRVAQVSALLGKLYGLTHRDVELLEIVSPMHDVGKIAVSESILEKPGKLTEQEWALIQTHTLHGHRLLSSGDGHIFKLAATVAYQHHERWDGKGYPEGLAGEDIHIFARITAVADVFDALLSERCYKKAWTIDQVIELFNQEQGKQFDPQLTALFLRHIDKFIEIRNASPDK